MLVRGLVLLTWLPVQILALLATCVPVRGLPLIPTIVVLGGQHGDRTSAPKVNALRGLLRFTMRFRDGPPEGY